MKEFDGYMSDSYFSGILIKFEDKDDGIGQWGEGECIRAFTYIC